MSTTKVSIIIPCYNAVSCIDACLESLVNQTMPLEELQIVLVNDASTDDTLDKLCQWEQRYPDSIMVIHCEENGKQGQARNIGMQYAVGEYIGFMDDDDYVEPDMYETLYNMANCHQCDLAICQSLKRKSQETISENKPVMTEQEDFLKAEQILTFMTREDRQSFLERDVNIAIWNKLYKRELLVENEISFPPGYIYDDIVFSGLVKQYCQKVCITDKVLYHHIISDSSVSYGAKNPMERIGFIEVHMILIEELRNRGLYNDFKEWYEEQFVVDYLTFIVNYEKTFGALNNDIKHILRNSVRELFPDFQNIPLVQLIVESENKPVYKKILQELLQK